MRQVSPSSGAIARTGELVLRPAPSRLARRNAGDEQQAARIIEGEIRRRVRPRQRLYSCGDEGARLRTTPIVPKERAFDRAQPVFSLRARSTVFPLRTPPAPRRRAARRLMIEHEVVAGPRPHRMPRRLPRVVLVRERATPNVALVRALPQLRRLTPHGGPPRRERWVVRRRRATSGRRCAVRRTGSDASRGIRIG